MSEVASLIVDSEHKTAPKDPAGAHPMIRTTDLGCARVDLKAAVRVSSDTHARWTRRAVPVEGDLILAREAPVGGICRVPGGSRPILGQRTVLIRPDPTVIDGGFLLYRIAASDFQARLSEMSTGSTVPHLNMADIRALRIPNVPELRTQRRIAWVLSAFDELIEINERRIELLEDLARSLYCEWFVRFRFPGHGNDAGSPPNDWQTKPFLKTALFINGFAFKPTHHGPVGRPIIKIKELKQGVTQATPRYGGADVPPKFEVEPGHLLFSWSADLGAYLWNGEPGLLNQHLFRVEPLEDFSVEFLFHALDTAIPDFRSRAQGTTMRHIKRSALEEVMVSVPARSLVAQFTKRVRPLHGERRALSAENRTLAATRDLLLPRLVTGRLDISDVDLGDLLPAEGA